MNSFRPRRRRRGRAVPPRVPVVARIMRNQQTHPRGGATAVASGMDTFRQDLVYAIRQVERAPGFAAVAILTLGLAIGANTAIFSIVDSILLRPLPYQDSD